MKNKIKIMDKRQEITDEELERFKNFEALLIQRQQAVRVNRWARWKVIIPVVLVIGLITTHVFFDQNDDKNLESASNSEMNLSSSDSALDKPRVQADTPKVKLHDHSSQQKSSTSKERMIKTPPVTPEPLALATEEKPVVETPIQEETKTEQKENNPKVEPTYEQAVPVNGYETLYEYFNKELIYPAIAVKDSIQGVLTVTFIINKEGRPEKIKVTGGLGEAFDKEAIRLIENMPSWKPAMLDGQPVISRLSLPLTFNLNNKK